MTPCVYTCIDDADDEEVQEIPLPNVKSPILSKVIEFCSHHHNNPMREIEKVGRETCMGMYTGLSTWGILISGRLGCLLLLLL